MLKIKDKEGKLKFILLDDSEEPEDIDELILQDVKNQKKKKELEKKKLEKKDGSK